MTDTLQWPWMWSPGTAKLQAHHGLLQCHLTGQAGRPLGDRGCWAQQHHLCPLEVRYMHKHLHAKEQMKCCAESQACLSFTQSSKTVILWGRIPAPDPGVLQVSSVKAEVVSSSGRDFYAWCFHQGVDVFKGFIAKCSHGPRNWLSPMICFHWFWASLKQ